MRKSKKRMPFMCCCCNRWGPWPYERRCPPCQEAFYKGVQCVHSPDRFEEWDRSGEPVVAVACFAEGEFVVTKYSDGTIKRERG